MMDLERTGWGGREDPTDPIGQAASAQACRELALRSVLELLTDSVLGATLQPLYSARAAADPMPHQILVRLLTLLRELVSEILSKLHQAVRCDSTQRGRWSGAPVGGRVDVAASVRGALAQTGSEHPEQWLVWRVERQVETPVNRLALYLLRSIESRLDGVLRLSLSGDLFRGERSLVRSAREALGRFVATSPLCTLPPRSDSECDLLAAARMRPRELALLAPLRGWCHRLDETDLGALQRLYEDGTLAEMSVSACYEMACATSLLLALRSRFPPETARQPGHFALRSPRGLLRVELAAGRERPFGRRPFTARLAMPDGSEVIIEARNLRADAAADTAERLHYYCESRAGRSRALLLLPTQELPRLHAGETRLRCIPFFAGLATGQRVKPLTEWAPILDVLQYDPTTSQRGPDDPA